jgi:hypothetical protein
MCAIASREFDMSIYRKLNPVPADNLHYFERQRRGAIASAGQDASEWLQKRKAKPYEHLLVTTIAWRNALPLTLQPVALCERFPRIANGLASGWRDPEAMVRCFDDLLTDKRGGRRGFTGDVLEELYALKAHYDAVQSRRGIPLRA